MSTISKSIHEHYPAHLDAMGSRFTAALAPCTGASGFLIPSGDLIFAWQDDQDYPFRVNPHFNSWLPVTGNHGSFIVLRPDERPKLLFHQPRDYWHLPAADPEGFWVDRWDIDIIRSPEEVVKHVKGIHELVFLGAETDIARAWGMSRVNPAAAIDVLNYERAYKTDYELGCMQLATDAAVPGHLAARQAFLEGASEFEIQHRYLGAIRHREQQTPYSSIIALNEHASVLHYQHYDLVPPGQSRSLLIDAGASHLGYKADITRTHCRDSRDSPDSRETGLYSALLDDLEIEQQAIIGSIQPGVGYDQLHANMQLRLAGLLAKHDIVDLAPEVMVEENLTHGFMPHGLGHLLGLQTHDVGGVQSSASGSQRPPDPRYPALRLTRPIDERMVFTIEPGLYFIQMLLEELRQSRWHASINWDAIEGLSQFGGIRIEDNIAIIDGKTVNMTREAFAQYQEDPDVKQTDA